jgi:hypothetical protein
MKNFSSRLRSFALAALLPGLLLGGGLGLRSARRPSPPATAARAPAPLARQGCPLSTGDRLAFRLEARENVAIELGPTQKPVGFKINTKSLLQLRAIGTIDGATLLAAMLSETALSDEDGSAVEAGDTTPPFLLTVGEDCSIAAMGHKQGAEPRGARLQQALARSIEWRIAPGQVNYVALQRDGVGEKSLRYGHGSRRDGAEILQRRVTHIPVLWPRAVAAEARVVSSFGEARLGAGPWLEESHEEQILEIERGSSHEKLERSINVVRAEPPAIDPFEGLDLDPSRFQWGDRLEQAPKGPGSATNPAASALASRSLDDVLDEALQIDRDSRAGKGQRTSARALAAYLRANPSAAAGVVQRLRAGKIPAALRAPLSLALSLADTPEARAALVAVARDAKLAFDDRLRALHGAATTAHPGPIVADALREVSLDRRDPSAERAATLALGSLAGTQKRADPALARQVRQQLGERLEQERDPERLTGLLAAAGNSAGEDLLPAVERLGAHRDPSVRAAAVDALGALSSPEAAARQVALMEAETDPAASRAMLLGESQRGGRVSPELVALAARRLETEGDLGARRALIELLGHARDSDTAMEALRARFRLETDPGLLQLLGRFVPASELP